MAVQSRLEVRPAQLKDRPELTNILHFETYVHRHLDWRQPLDWLGYEPFLVIENSGKLDAALACPPDPPGVAWIRMFATTKNTSSKQAWESFWPQIKSFFADQSNTHIAAIPLQNWFETLLKEQGFAQSHDVIMLIAENTHNGIPSPSNAASIRPMSELDLDDVSRVDTKAFATLWHNSLESLKLAFQQATVATVAETDGEIVGYQMSTPSPIGAHLARLAVLPEAQGQGIGYALVADLLSNMRGLGGKSVSVNTQQDNLSSLALYEKAGFNHTGETFPVYKMDLI